MISSEVTGTFRSRTTGKDEVVRLSGSWLASRVEITRESTGAVVAFIDRKLLGGRPIIFGNQTYALVVAPGVDMALMVAMCIALNEKYHGAKGRKSLAAAASAGGLNGLGGGGWTGGGGA